MGEDSIRLVVIERAYSRKNPGLKSLVSATPELLRRGYRIEAWCGSIDDDLKNRVSLRRIPSIKLPGTFGSMASWFLVGLVAGIRRLIERGRERTVYLTMGGQFWFPDISFFQFYNPTWFRIQKTIRFWGPETRLRRWLTLWGVWEELGVLRMPACRRVLSVSRAIQKDICKDARPNCTVSVLPNCVDREKLSEGQRAEWREPMRSVLGYREEETVLIFISMGHYVRKGLWLAVETLARLRSGGHKEFRFLVVGGRPRKLSQIRRHLEQEYPDWQEWLQLTGTSDEVPKLLAASDALFFPSYFEAFSLVEIEAACMGLPLILTRHHGSEMILKDGRNGIFVPFDPDQIGQQLLEFRKNGLPDPAVDTGDSLTVEEWAEEMDRHIQEVARNKEAGDLEGKPTAAE